MFLPISTDPCWKERLLLFQENPDYLKELGVLDDGDQVIVPNFVGPHTNCIASSSLYSVCRIDACESVMGQLEREIAAPEAIPNTITGLIFGMSFSRMRTSKFTNRMDDRVSSDSCLCPVGSCLFLLLARVSFQWGLCRETRVCCVVFIR